ncbi:MAG: hypothetical protein HYR85_08210 [Planctomycetes bacterium]|nr:hypothetical protein [Planctomycetota bacterium]
MFATTRFASLFFFVAALASTSGDPYLLDIDPVSGEKLGENPVIVQAEGRELRFASQANADAFKADPAKYRAAIDEKLTQQQLPFYPLDTCPVSSAKLGGMGKPVDVVVGNRLVRFCCGGCKPKFEKDPATFLAKLDEAVIAKQKPGYPLGTCVVSGDKLGGEMGKPVDVVIGNRLVRLCCSDCIRDLRANPRKFLAKLDAAAPAK